MAPPLPPSSRKRPTEGRKSDGRPETKRKTTKRRRTPKYAVPTSVITAIATNVKLPPPPPPPARTASSTTFPANFVALWEISDVILYHIAEYVAPPTERAAFFCLTLAPLCRASHQALLVDESKCAGLWSLVLSGDYGGVGQNRRHGCHHRHSNKHNNKRPPRRSCARLQKSPLGEVQAAHRLVRDNTEIAYYYLWELSSSTTKNSLTRAKLEGILNEYGPRLMINKTMSTGGTFLVEVCRSRNATTQHALLQCAEVLVERWGAGVNIATAESANCKLTALCVASVRGMPKVVDYLLKKGADSTTIRCSGRFRLHTHPKKSLRCNDCTPLEFAKRMLEAEMAEGANKNNLKDLNKCIQLLEQSSSS